MLSGEIAHKNNHYYHSDCHSEYSCHLQGKYVFEGCLCGQECQKAL